MMNLNEILKQSPVDPNTGERMAYYAVRCCWWTSFRDDLGSTGNFRTPAPRVKKEFARFLMAHHLPCCPHCESVLLQAPLDAFIRPARENPDHYGRHGLRAFELAHSRNANFCYRGWDSYNTVLDLREIVEN